MPSSPADDGPADSGDETPTACVLDRSLELVRFLRANCPWDAAQTPRSLVPHLLEESHETVDAIQDGDDEALEGELGDLLLNVAFQVVLGEERGAFDAESVTRRLEAKMERRHPHLYGGEKEAWEAIKARERARAGGGVLDGLARGLDPLTRAHRIQEKVAGVGFDWDDVRGAWEKLAEEMEEVRAVLESGDPEEPEEERQEELEEELGDLLFAVVNVVRRAGSHPTTALDRANRKFHRRFARLETLAAERGIDLGEAGLEALDRLWDEVKAREREAADDGTPPGPVE